MMENGMKRIVMWLALMVAYVGVALADFTYPPVQTYPAVRPNIDNQSSTIAVTNTFQQVWALNSNRIDCLIQNNSASNSMWVFPGVAASATKGTSVVLAAGQAFYCTYNGVDYTGAVSITGTSGDAYYATGK